MIGGTTGKVAFFLIALLSLAAIPLDAATTAPVITILLNDGTTVLAARVEHWPHGFVRTLQPDGRQDFVASEKIQRIRDEEGIDWTVRVIENGAAAGEPVPETRRAPAVPGVPRMRGRPLPLKKAFPIIQGGILSRMDYASFPHDASEIGLLDFGAIRNVTPRYGVGGTFCVEFDEDMTRLGAKARLRRWFSRTISLDFAPGITVTAPNQYLPYIDPGFVGELSLSLGDWVAVTGQVEFLSRYLPRYGFAPGGFGNSGAARDTEVGWYLGVKLGGELGIPAFLAALITAWKPTHYSKP